MKFNKMHAKFGIILCAIFGNQYALADIDSENDSRWYIGGSFGPSKNRIDHDKITAGLLYGGITTGGQMATESISDQNKSNGYKLYGGYRFGDTFSMEAGYFNLGKFGFVAQTNPLGTLKGSLNARGLALDGIATVRLTKDLSGFGRAGLILGQAHATFSQTGSVVILRPDWNKTALGVKAGVGLEYALAKSMNLRLEGEIYQINDAVGHRENISLISIGLTYRFGNKTDR